MSVYAENLVELIAEAVNNAGPVPAYHIAQIRHLQEKWPTLWEVIEECARYDKVVENCDHEFTDITNDVVEGTMCLKCGKLGPNERQ